MCRFSQAPTATVGPRASFTQCLNLLIENEIRGKTWELGKDNRIFAHNELDLSLWAVNNGVEFHQNQ